MPAVNCMCYGTSSASDQRCRDATRAAQAKQGSIARIANSAVFEQAVTQGA